MIFLSGITLNDETGEDTYNENLAELFDPIVIQKRAAPEPVESAFETEPADSAFPKKRTPFAAQTPRSNTDVYDGWSDEDYKAARKSLGLDEDAGRGEVESLIKKRMAETAEETRDRNMNEFLDAEEEKECPECNSNSTSGGVCDSCREAKGENDDDPPASKKDIAG